jgi:hypothetical protein
MIDMRAALECVNRMAALSFFPKEPEARAAIAEMVIELANEPEEAIWLARRMLTLYNEWPGPREMRAVFCSRFVPRDGYEVYSAVYPDGIPSEREQRPALPAANPRSRIVSGDEELCTAITRIAGQKSFKKNGKG